LVPNSSPHMRRRRPGVPAASSEEARRRMIATRSEDTGPERRLRSELHNLGLRFRLHQRVIPGVRRQADIVFGPARVAVFVDGCFWHSCPIHETTAKANAAFWKKKLADNIRRDADTNARLEAAGWKVIRIWEHEQPSLAAQQIAKAVRRRRRRLGGRSLTRSRV